MIAKKHAAFVKANDRFYAVAVVMWEMLRLVAPQSHWHRRLSDLFGQFNRVNTGAMGFPQDWRQQPFWNLNHVDFVI